MGPLGRLGLGHFLLMTKGSVHFTRASTYVSGSTSIIVNQCNNPLKRNSVADKRCRPDLCSLMVLPLFNHSNGRNVKGTCYFWCSD